MVVQCIGNAQETSTLLGYFCSCSDYRNSVNNNLAAYQCPDSDIHGAFSRPSWSTTYLYREMIASFGYFNFIRVHINDECLLYCDVVQL